MFGNLIKLSWNAGGNKAMMKAATRTTALMTAGTGGFVVDGPVGAVAGGVSAVAGLDLVAASASDGIWQRSQRRSQNLLRSN